MANTETKAPAPAGARSSRNGNETMETVNNDIVITSAPSSEFSHLTREELESGIERAQARIAELDHALTIARGPISDGSDSRLAPFWEKAQALAVEKGFCAEYDKIAHALGGPTRQLAWSGSAQIEVTVTVSVPVCGVGTAEEVESGDVTYDVDEYDILEAMREQVSRYDLTWEDQNDVDITETEPYSD